MTINIGLIIWKEMKAKSFTREELSEKTGISTHRLGKIIQGQLVDTDKLMRISIALEVNIFSYFAYDPQTNYFKTSDMEIAIDKRNEILDFLEDKNKLLALKDSIIKNQAESISRLEKLLTK